MLAALVPTFALSASLPAGACASAPRTAARNGQVSQRLLRAAVLQPASSGLPLLRFFDLSWTRGCLRACSP